MPSEIITTAGDSAANSYGSLEESDVYFEDRAALPTPWVSLTEDQKTALLLMATRVLDYMSVPHKRLVKRPGFGSRQLPYYVTSRAWTGAVATLTQALAWPRVGMYDRLGRAIPEDVIPVELKHAQFELAGQLAVSDTTLDNDAAVQGIASVKAGSVEVKFREMIESHVLPTAVLNMLVPSWLSDEIVTAAVQPSFRAL